MKNLYFLLFLVFAVNANSQTLTQTQNEPKSGDVVLMVPLDTSGYTSGIPLTQIGANQNWDYSKLKTAADPDSIKYLAPAAVPGSSLYPQTTVVHRETAWDIFLKSATTPTTQTEILGLQNMAFSVTFTNSAIAAKFPISFGSTNSDNCAGSALTNLGSYNCSGKITYTADGTGTLTLADGFKYNNVIRLKTILTFTATQFSFPVASFQRTLYEFYDMSEKFPVFFVDYINFEALGTPSLSAGVMGNSKSFTGISEHSYFEKLFQLYPNPGTNNVNLISPIGLEVKNIELISASGALVKQYSAQGGSSASLDLTGLDAGLYLLKFKAGDRELIKRLVKE